LDDLEMTLLRPILDVLRRFVRFDEGCDVTEYVSSLAQYFSVKLSPHEVESIFTLREMADLISRKVCESGRSNSNDGVWAEVRRITSEEFGVDARELNPGIRYVEDLNC
jgi:hypothetical protein